MLVILCFFVTVGINMVISLTLVMFKSWKYIYVTSYKLLETITMEKVPKGGMLLFPT